MNTTTIPDRDEARARSARATRNALIVIAIVEAIVIFGAFVPAVLKSSSPIDRPHPTTGGSHE